MAHEKTSLVHWIVLLACEQARDHHKANQVATLGSFPGVDSVKLMDRLHMSGLILRRYSTEGNKDVVRRHLHDLAVPGRLIQAQSFDRTQPTRYVPTPYAEKLYGQLDRDGLLTYALSRDGRKNLVELFLWGSYHAKLSDRTRSVDDLLRDCALPGRDRLQGALDRLKRGIRIPVSLEEGGLKILRLASREVDSNHIQMWTREGEPPARTHVEGVDFALPDTTTSLADGLVSAAEKLVPGAASSSAPTPGTHDRSSVRVEPSTPDTDDLRKAEPEQTTPATPVDPSVEERTDQLRAEHRDGEWKVERLEHDKLLERGEEALPRGVFDLALLPASVYEVLSRTARLHGHSVQDEVRHILVGDVRRARARSQLRQAITDLLMEEFS